ncbi:MAG: preprotein translocase subunit SecA, partial [Verrucomicrobiota bacterium]
ISKAVRDAYDLKVSFERTEALAAVERYTILGAIDRLWQEHLYSMDSLRNSIGLRAYGQRDPLLEYKAEAFKLFDELMVNIKTEICHNIFRSASSLMAFEQFLVNLPKLQIHQPASAFGGDTSGADPGLSAPDPAPGPSSELVSEAAEVLEKARPAKSTPRVGRNDPCPGGSGKKDNGRCGR